MDSNERFEWAVAGVVVALAGAAVLASAAFFLVPMVDYSLTWWRLFFEVTWPSWVGY